MHLSPEKFDRLCRTATDAFLATGYLRTSIDDVVNAAQVSRSTIYHHFSSKKQFFNYLISREIEFVVRNPFNYCAVGDFENSLYDLARQQLQNHISERSIKLQRLLIAEATVFPVIAQAFYASSIEKLRVPLIKLFDEYDLPKPTEAIIRVFHTLATFGMLFLSSPAHLNRDQIDRLARDAAKIMTHGVGNPGLAAQEH